MGPITRLTEAMFEVPFRMFELPFVMSAVFMDALVSDSGLTNGSQKTEAAHPPARKGRQGSGRRVSKMKVVRHARQAA